MIKRILAAIAALLAAIVGLVAIRRTKTRTIEEFREETDKLEGKIKNAKERAELAEKTADVHRREAEKASGLVDARRSALKRIDKDEALAKDFNRRRRSRGK